MHLQRFRVSGVFLKFKSKFKLKIWVVLWCFVVLQWLRCHHVDMIWIATETTSFFRRFFSSKKKKHSLLLYGLYFYITDPWIHIRTPEETVYHLFVTSALETELLKSIESAYMSDYIQFIHIFLNLCYAQ